MNQTPQDTIATQPRRKAALFWGAMMLLVIAAWSFAAYQRSAPGEAVSLTGWQDGLPAGKEVAASEEKSMIVLFTADWCGPCQQLKGNVFQDPSVTAALEEDYVAVKVDLTDRSRNNPNLPAAQAYNIRDVPTILALSPDGSLISQYPFNGRDTPGDFMLWLSMVGPIDGEQVFTAGSR